MNLNEVLQPMNLPAWLVSLPLLAAGLSVVLPRHSAWTAFFSAITMPFLVFCLGREVIVHGSIEMHVGGWQTPLGISLYADGLTAAGNADSYKSSDQEEVSEIVGAINEAIIHRG